LFPFSQYNHQNAQTFGKTKGGNFNNSDRAEYLAVAEHMRTEAQPLSNRLMCDATNPTR